MEPKVGYIALVRLKKQTGIAQGAWALCMRPGQDEMSSIRPEVLAPDATPADFRSGRYDLTEDMLFFESNLDAQEDMERFAASNYIYQMTGDYELIKVQQKKVTIYRGYEAVP